MKAEDEMEKYFLGGNTAFGFRGFHDAEIARADRAILLKGGPGTGKSSLMKRIAREAAERGMDTEMWMCSGDPSSADGVYIKDLDTVVADATSPHAVEASLPVIRDRIEDMARALSREKLLPHAKEIADLLSVKKGCYESAYKHLKSAYGHYLKKTEVYSRHADIAAIRRMAAADALRFEDGKGAATTGRGEPRVRFSRAITPDGDVSYHEHLIAKRVHFVKGSASGAEIYLEELMGLVGADVALRNPLTGEGVTGFVVGDDAFTADAGPFVTAATAIDISACERDAAGVTEFWAAREREEVRLAVSALSSAREAHLAVEEFFVAAMDFSVTENIADRLTAEIFG